MNTRIKSTYSLRPIAYAESPSLIESRPQLQTLFGVPKNYFVILLAFMILIASSLFWVWVRVEHIKSAYHINDLQNKLVQLDEEQRLLEVERSSLRRPDRLRRLAKERFQMNAPRSEQVLRLNQFSL